jgi:tRNA dimethylallyltransferase
LAVELAARFNGEIINADAIQMYEGLPIITNKMPVAERKNIPHHLLGSINSIAASWTVQQFLLRTLQIVSCHLHLEIVPAS